MKILIIGGTVFLGRHFTEATLAAGHEVTLFNRGQRGPDLFPEARRIVGDRKTDIATIEGEFDIVLDTCGYFPRDVTASARHLADQAQQYIFISSLSVFADAFTTPGVDEDGELLPTDYEAVEVTGDNYGGLKAGCERAVEKAMPGRVLVIRPGLIVGPFDQSDRFTYWAARLRRGGEILAPGPERDPVQYIDVRDLAEWTLRMAQDRATGIFNANGLAEELSMQTALEAGLRMAGGNGWLTWVDGQWLKDQGVTPWTEMPLWVPGAIGFSRFDTTRAITAGLAFRTIEDTFRATMAWEATRDVGYEWKAGMAAERELELLEAWHARSEQPG
jgi:2'-hydroxyisoflavone reductase